MLGTLILIKKESSLPSGDQFGAVGSSHLVILCDGAEIPLLVKVAKRTVGDIIQINNNLQGYSAIMGFHPINISRSESGKIRKVGGMYMSFIASGHPQ